MKRIIAICGKICSGKSYYAKQLKEKEQAVVLSCDDLTKILFDNNLGDRHDEMAKRIWDYLLALAVDIAEANTSVILDWGFWSKKDRAFACNYFKSKNIPVEVHFVDIDQDSWEKNIKERNQRILLGKGGSDYFLDEGLKDKLLSRWEEPTDDEIDVSYKVIR